MAEIQRGEYYIEQIAEDTWKIYERREATMYLVCGGERACLIDTGFGLRDLKALAGQLTGLPVAVVNTHGHVDHVLGNRWFCDAGSARLHAADRPMYDSLASGFAQMLDLPWVRQTYGAYIEDMDPAAIRFPTTRDIREGEAIDLGGRTLEVLETPGHTAGSILLLDRSAGICYSGDSIVEHLWLFLEESLPPETYLASLRRAREALAQAGVERIYNGHFNRRPLALPQVDAMIAGMERVVAGRAEGAPFTNQVGSGIEYAFGDWSVLCRDSAAQARERSGT